MINQLLLSLENCTEPTKGSKYSAAVDLYSSQTTTMYPGTTHIIGLGVKISKEQLEKLTPEIREHFMLRHYLALHPRSSFRAKGMVSNTGIIDMDYPDEIKIILHYPEGSDQKPFEIKKGDRIAQIMLMSHDSMLLNVHSEEERTGGIGSTGT